MHLHNLGPHGALCQALCHTKMTPSSRYFLQPCTAKTTAILYEMPYTQALVFGRIGFWPNVKGSAAYVSA